MSSNPAVEKAVLDQVEKSGKDGISSVVLKSILAEKYRYNDVVLACRALVNKNAVKVELSRVVFRGNSMMAYIYTMTR